MTALLCKLVDEYCRVCKVAETETQACIQAGARSWLCVMAVFYCVFFFFAQAPPTPECLHEFGELVEAEVLKYVLPSNMTMEM